MTPVTASSPFDALADRLSDALDAFDWEETERLCGAIEQQISEPVPADAERPARRMLRDLRRKRRFPWLERLAEAWMLAGLKSPQIQRQYAQALLDQNRFAAAEAVLALMIANAATGAAERAEARGLIGRLWKQLYVAPGDAAVPPRPAFLQRAIEAYWQVYREGPLDHLWHGINVVALLARAERDELALAASYPPFRDIASSILSALDARQQDSSEAPPAFDVATRLEALVALGRWSEAEREAAAYVRCREADAFELGSTVRQFTEVWKLSTHEGGGGAVLSILRAVLLQRQGGSVTLTSGTTGDERRAVDGAAHDARLEAVLGHDRSRTLAWYRNGLECCESVARIETRSGRGFGTGWLVRGEDLASRWAGQTLLITNKHVISPGVDGRPYVPAPSRQALLPHEAVVYLQLHGARLDVSEVVWTSPDLELDATVLRVKGLPSDARPLGLYPEVVTMNRPPARVYLIGHPAGRDLELSLHDNAMLACDARRLHYRAPTEGGSSGSPVFEAEGWRVVGLHHAGGRGLPRLDADGTYDANEGITIHALRQAMAQPS